MRHYTLVAALRADGCKPEWLLPHHPDVWHGLGTASIIKPGLITAVDQGDEEAHPAPAPRLPRQLAVLTVPYSEELRDPGEHASLRWLCKDFLSRGEVDDHGNLPIPLSYFCNVPHPDDGSPDDRVGGFGGKDDEQDSNKVVGEGEGDRREGEPTGGAVALPLERLASLQVRVYGPHSLLAGAPKVSIRALGNGSLAVDFQPVEPGPHRVTAFVATASRAGTLLDPEGGGVQGRWMPEWPMLTLPEVTVHVANTASDGAGASRAGTLAAPLTPVCGGASTGAWRGSVAQMERAYRRDHMHNCGSDDTAPSTTFDAEEEDEGSSISSLENESSPSSSSSRTRLKWVREGCRKCATVSRSAAEACLARKPLVMLGDSLMLQQCHQLKQALGTPAGDANRCDVSLRVEDWPAGTHPPPCNWTGPANSVVCVDLSV